MRRAVLTTIALALAAAMWIPVVHLFFDEAPDEEALLRTQLALWEEPARRTDTIERMRGANAEWDFMGRTFLVLALADRAIVDPRLEARHLAVIDTILEETLRLEEERGQRHFLMSYVDHGVFVDPSGRSVFVDGEIALMLAVRQRVRESDRWREPLAARIALITAQMERSPVLGAESYPDECWTFCNALALAAIRTSDSVTGDDHSDFLRRWIAMAERRLIDPETGMLVSSFTHDGQHMDGPEGSSIFMVAHVLQVIDPSFAGHQAALAREHLAVSFAGFGWAREWPRSWEGPPDVDSGPVIPIVHASAGASGMALIGATGEWQRELHRSIALAAFPIREEGELRYAASNQVGDAVLLYSLSNEALWDAIGAPDASVPVAARGER